MSILLAIDIGNTNVSLGIFKNAEGKEYKTSVRSRIASLLANQPSPLICSWRLATSFQSTADEYGTKILDLIHYATIQRLEITAVAIASVVPPLNSVFEDLAQKYFKIKPVFIGKNMKIPISVLCENPNEVGADRIVNSVSASSRFGGPCVIVDFGTATTFDCLNKKGDYTGGMIVPGPVLASEILSLKTARLPKVEIAKPKRLIGKNTVESIQSGLYFGYISLVDGLIDRIKSELGGNCKVVSTGGLAGLIAEGSKFIKKELIFPDLTLDGIRIVWEKNQ